MFVWLEPILVNRDRIETLNSCIRYILVSSHGIDAFDSNLDVIHIPNSL